MVAHYYSILQAHHNASEEKAKENIFILLPPELRKCFFELLVDKNEPKVFKLALSYVIDLLTPPEEIPGGAEGKDSLVGDLFFKHHKTNFLEVLLDVFPDLVLAVDAELSLGLLESSIFQGHPLILKCLLKSVRARVEGHAQRRADQVKRQVARYLRGCLVASREWLGLVGAWPESITFTTSAGDTLVHSLLCEGSPEQILRNVLDLRQAHCDSFHRCRAVRNNRNFLPYTWFFRANLHRGSAFFESQCSYNILHVLNYTSKAWELPPEQLDELLLSVIIQTGLRTGPSLQMLKNSLFIRRKSLGDKHWFHLLSGAASQPAAFSPAPFSVLLSCWPSLSGLVMKFWDPMTGEGPLHLLIRRNNVKALREFMRTTGLSFRLSDMLLDLEGIFFAPADPVVTAVKTRNLESLRFLLEEGRADPNGFERSRLVDNGAHDLTPLSVALDLPQPSNKRMVGFLLEHGANPNKVSSMGEPFLHSLLQDPTFSTIELQKLFQKHRFDFRVQSRLMVDERFHNGFQAALQHRGVERVLFLLETVPGLADFAAGQLHPFMFALGSLDKKAPGFMRHMLLLRRILAKKNLSQRHVDSPEWEKPHINRGLQIFMDFVPDHPTLFQLESLMSTFSFHFLFTCRDLVGLVSEYVAPQCGGPFSPLDLFAHVETL